MSQEPTPKPESKIVTAVGVAVSRSGSSRAKARRIQDVMNAEILKCNAEGISTSEENSQVIRERMMAARERELEAIRAEETEALKPKEE